MKFKQMVVICDNIEELKKLYFDKCITEYIIDVSNEDKIQEIARDEIEIMQINNTIVLPVVEFCSIKDMIGILKVNNLNGIVLEALTTTYDKKYVGFANLGELIDFVINEKKQFKFIDSTAQKLSKRFTTNTEKMEELYKISKDSNILLDTIKDVFMF
jgi:hypothetical protein